MQTNFGQKIKKLFHICQDEVKKTTEISKKMISASKTSTELNEAYQELGSLVFKDIKSDSLEWKNPQAKKILKSIEACEDDLHNLEDDVVTLKSKNH